MENAKLLAQWIIPNDTEILDIHLSGDISPIFCGNCFKKFSNKGSSFTITCSSCGGFSNMGYEIQQLGFILRTPYKVTVYLATKALDELMRDNNDISLMRGILHGN